MDKEELAGDQLIVEIQSPEKKPNSAAAIDNQDPSLRSRKKASSFKASSTPSPSEPPNVTGSPPQIEDDDDDDDDERHQDNLTLKDGKKNRLLQFIELSIFVSILLVLILSKTMNKLKKREIWSLELWKWCVIVMPMFCGRMLSEWLMKVIVFFIERHFLLKKKVLYFVYGIKKSVRNFIWLGLVLLKWVLLINRGAHRSKHTTKIVNYITRGIASTLVVAGLWIFKTLFVKMLASSIHINRFFDKIQECLFEQYVVETLSGPPFMESNNSPSLPTKQSSFKRTTNDGVQKLQKMKSGRVSDSTIRKLIKVVRKLKISKPYNELDNAVEEDEQELKTITNEWEAKTGGLTIYKNVAKLGHKYIEEDDLLRFMSRDEVKKLLELIGGKLETGKIMKKSFVNWVVNVYKKRKYMAASLEGTKKAMMQINKFITGFTVVVLLILWLILMGITTTEVLLFISSQFLLAIFSFGTSFKSALEAVMFVFVNHPFDVGDRCVLDGVQVVVEEVSIMTTVFLRYDNEKIYYPNSLLATKAISNFNRSPEMSDSVDFELDVSTSEESIAALKAKVKAYIYSNPELWRPRQSLRVREIEGKNKMKLTLDVTHTINFQDYELKSERRSNLVLELKKIFEQLEIDYHILPTTATN